jgi:hypothetical protein
MTNLAIDLLPKSLDDIYGHEGIITIIKNWIAKDTLPYLIFISGKSGTGKGSIVHNIVKTTLCLNRKDGDSHNCGRCAICKIDPRTTNKSNNVMWVQPGNNNGTIDSQVTAAITYATEPPIGNPTDGSRHHKFIVFDEIQSIKTPLLEQLAFSTELPAVVRRNKVTFILITMDEAKLQQKQPSLVDALKSRAGKGYIRLTNPSKARLHQYALDKLGLEDNDIRSILVDYANCSYRQLIAGYEKLTDLPELNINLVQASLNLASTLTRLKLWTLFNNATDYKSLNELKDYWSYLLDKFPEESIVKQLLDDIDLFILNDKQHKIPLEFIKSLLLYIHDSNSFPFWFLFRQFAGQFTVNTSVLANIINTDHDLL